MTRGLAARLSGKRVVICAGAGGVGKTTVSATVAIGLAARGSRVAVVTIDPARRLAEALGLDELGNEPQLVDVAGFEASGLEFRGELSAMMLDPKRTLDELIEQLTPDVRTREAILANPVYDHLSKAVGGSQEYSAVAKLFELEQRGDHEVIVLDTPPSRSAIDFLDAPQRLTGFLEGRALGALLRPTGPLARAAGVVVSALRRITGGGLLEDLTAFFQLFSGLLEGFEARAAGVERLLTDPATAFLVVTSTERAPLEEAIHFAGELERAGMRRAGVIVNRVHALDPTERDTVATMSRLTAALGLPLARKVARTHADVQLLARRDEASLGLLRAALQDPDPFWLADRPSEIRDISGLVALYGELFGGMR